MSDDLKALVQPFEHAAPTVMRALNEAPQVAVKALAEQTGNGTAAKPEAVHAALMDLPLAGILDVLSKAEMVLSTILAPLLSGGTEAPIDGDDSTADPDDDGSAPAPSPTHGPLDQLLGGGLLAGWKTIIGILAYVVVNVAASFHALPAILTSDVVAALDTFIGGIIGVGLVAKLDRYLSWLKPQG